MAVKTEIPQVLLELKDLCINLKLYTETQQAELIRVFWRGEIIGYHKGLDENNPDIVKDKEESNKENK